jgi:HSP20 family protein
MAKELTGKRAEVPAPWRPSIDLDRWERDAERMMEQFFGRTMMPWRPQGWLRSEAAAVNPPAVDVFIDKDEVVITAELAGMEKDDIEVKLSDHSLTLNGDKKRKEKVKEECFHCSERAYGRFSRTVELPMDVHGEKVKASFANGVLEIRLPIAQTAKAKTINVKVEDGPTTTGQD